MKVHELIAALQQLPPELEILTTWEGIERRIDANGLWLTPNNIVLLNAEGSNAHYRESYESGDCKVRSQEK